MWMCCSYQLVVGARCGCIVAISLWWVIDVVGCVVAISLWWVIDVVECIVAISLWWVIDVDVLQLS